MLEINECKHTSNIVDVDPKDGSPPFPPLLQTTVLSTTLRYSLPCPSLSHLLFSSLLPFLSFPVGNPSMSKNPTVFALSSIQHATRDTFSRCNTLRVLFVGQNTHNWPTSSWHLAAAWYLCQRSLQTGDAISGPHAHLPELGADGCTILADPLAQRHLSDPLNGRLKHVPDRSSRLMKTVRFLCRLPHEWIHALALFTSLSQSLFVAWRNSFSPRL